MNTKSKIGNRQSKIENSDLPNVLIVDDRPENLLALEGVLSSLDINLVRANSGKETLKHVLNEDFALILLDVQMPTMDGFETASLIRGRVRSSLTPIVFVTAISTTQEHVSKGYSLGAVDYIIKPFSPEEMRVKVMVYVDIYLKKKGLEKELGSLVLSAQKTNILLVDDNKNNLLSMKSTLDILGENIMLAESGREALSLLMKHDFALIIADVHMPGMDGFEMAELIRQNDKLRHIPIVFITSISKTSKDVARGYALGAMDYIFMPCEPDILQAKAQALVNLYKKTYMLELQIKVKEIERLNIDLRKTEAALRHMNETLEEQVVDRTEELRISEKNYRSIFENAVEGIFQTTPDGRFLTANPAMARIHGYSSPEEIIPSITDIAHQLYVEPAQHQEFQDLLKETDVVKNFEAPMKRKDGTLIWVSMNARAVRDTNGNILYVEGTAEDITDRKKSEEALAQNIEKLRIATGGIVDVITAAVELRDPYTSGHQKRVASLARAIAKEMGLPVEQIDGIRMAGTIHDLGKISVPAEILSKPTKLTDIEFNLIKVHPQSGYNILKEIDFPWPIAQIVLQHHERIDGSGYPQGLKDGQILLEACILAVADVVEAMASHRPYRPALGIDKALEEIVQNKGIFYDVEAVDACKKLFKEKGFSFE